MLPRPLVGRTRRLVSAKDPRLLRTPSERTVEETPCFSAAKSHLYKRICVVLDLYFMFKRGVSCDHGYKSRDVTRS